MLQAIQKVFISQDRNPEAGWLQDSEGMALPHHQASRSHLSALLSSVSACSSGAISSPHDAKRAAEVPDITFSHDTSGGFCGSVFKIRKKFA